MSGARAVACAAALCALPFAGRLHAQSDHDWTVAFGVAGAQEIARLRDGTAPARLTGQVFSGEAVVTHGRFVARVRYGQGRVTNDTTARDVVEGEGLLGYNVRPWLTVWVGPQARTFVAPGFSDRRWLFWSARVTGRGTLFPGRVESFVEVWQGFAGSLNRPAGSARGGGIEAGLEVRLAPRRWWGRFAYRIEQGRVAGDRRETVEAVTLTIGYVPVR
ncbi:MAG: hypothetical protein ACREME_03130 [Gemmatimonadales bacterium]